MKKALKISGILLLILMLLAFIAPFIFKGKIIEIVKKEINANVNANVAFDDLGLSFFRHFPRVSVSLDNISVVGTDAFAGDTLIAAKEVDVAVNLMSIIRGSNIQVQKVFLKEPKLKALVNKEGLVSWDIMKPSEDTSADDTESDFRLELEHYEIQNGYLLYDDRQADTRAEIMGLYHSGSGNFTAEVFTLATKTKAEAVNFSYEAIPYLANTVADIKADIKIDNSTDTYTFDTKDVKLNDLRLNAAGSFQQVNDSTYYMDINFQTPGNEFKSILSMIPAIFKKDFDKIKTEGTAALNGMVKGTYSSTSIPAYDIHLEIKDGSFKYPDLPVPVNNIQVLANVKNSDGQTDNLEINIEKGHLEVEKEPFDFRLIFKNPETVQYIDAAIKGKLDLSQVMKFIKLDEGTALAGLIHADIQAKGRMKDLEQKSGPFTAAGFLNLSKLQFASKDFPQPIRNGEAKINIENNGGIADQTTIRIPAAHVEIGQDPIDFSLTVTKPVSDMNFSGAAKGQFNLANVHQFTTLEPGTSLKGMIRGDLTFSGSGKMLKEEKYDQVKFGGSVNLNDLVYSSDDYPSGIKIGNAALSLTPSSFVLNQLNGSYMNSDFSATGTLNNAIGYALHENQELSGNLSVKSKQLNLNQLMGDSSDESTDSTSADGPFLVPKNIRFNLTADIDKLIYDKVNYNQLRGSLEVKDQTVTLKNLQANALDGSITFNGSYSTRNSSTHPHIDLGYTIKDVDVQKAFYAFNTVQKLMPVGQFLNGKLSSQLSIDGNLGKDMMPMLNSLTGKGNFLLLEGFLSKFQPLEKLASALNVTDFQAISLKDIKGYFEFANGKVLVKPFTVKVKNIEMEIGGMHGLDQTLDYIVNIKMPRSKLGSQGDALLTNLISQANSKGFAVKAGETINLNVGMKGTISNPQLNYDLKEVVGDITEQFKDQAQEFVQSKIDSTKQVLKDTLNAVKDKAIKDATEQLKEKIFGKDTLAAKDSVGTEKKVENAIKNIKDLLKKKNPADTSKKN